jgi:hypothetical protein
MAMAHDDEHGNMPTKMCHHVADRILEDMGVLKELVDNNEAHFADAGKAQAAHIGQLS